MEKGGRGGGSIIFYYSGSVAPRRTPRRTMSEAEEGVNRYEEVVIVFDFISCNSPSFFSLGSGSDAAVTVH